jgi:hypothetical protein
LAVGPIRCLVYGCGSHFRASSDVVTLSTYGEGVSLVWMDDVHWRRGIKLCIEVFRETVYIARAEIRISSSRKADGTILL